MKTPQIIYATLSFILFISSTAYGTYIIEKESDKSLCADGGHDEYAFFLHENDLFEYNWVTTRNGNPQYVKFYILCFADYSEHHKILQATTYTNCFEAPMAGTYSVTWENTSINNFNIEFHFTIKSLDSDNDHYPDYNDDFPYDNTEWKDTDGDKIGDNSDAFPLDPTEWADSDNDTHGDNKDRFPMDPTEWNDTDNDSIGDNSDAFPNDPTEWGDMDGDGQGDNSDPDIDGDGWNNTFELEAGSDPYNKTSLPPDMDGDGKPDLLDDNIDGDYYNNEVDAFPYNPTEWTDTDGDGQGDNTDPDIDNDGWTNDKDAFPYADSEWWDTDKDGRGDNLDTDDDNDGYNDTQEEYYGTDIRDCDDMPPDIDGDKVADAFDLDMDGDQWPNDLDRFPMDPTEWLDNDNDTIGDNADLDDDNDGFLDSWEIANGTDPLDSLNFPIINNTENPPPEDGEEMPTDGQDGVGDGDYTDQDGESAIGHEIHDKQETGQYLYFIFVIIIIILISFFIYYKIYLEYKHKQEMKKTYRKGLETRANIARPHHKVRKKKLKLIEPCEVYMPNEAKK